MVTAVFGRVEAVSSVAVGGAITSTGSGVLYSARLQYSAGRPGMLPAMQRSTV